MLRIKLFFKRSLVLLAAAVLVGCGGDAKEESAAPENDIAQADREEITAMLDELVFRFKYRDKAALYENELEFLREEYTFDEYRRHNTIRFAQADSVVAFKVLDIKLFGRDSARVRDEVELLGFNYEPRVINNEYTVYYNQGRWLKPTIGFYPGQLEYEQKKADSGQ